MEETEKKPKRALVRKAKKQAAKEQLKARGSSLARLRGVPSSPRKMRLVADLIRGEQVSKAFTILKHETKYPAVSLEKLLLSAVSGWELKNPDLKLEDSNLYVKQIYVDEGRALKRIKPAPQGRANRIRKRSNHVTLVVESIPVAEKKKNMKRPKNESDGTKN